PRRDRAPLPARVHAGRDRGAVRAAARDGELSPAPRARPARRSLGGGRPVTDLGRRLRSLPVPDEDGATERAWGVVRAAFEEREPVSWPRRHTRPLLAAAAGLAVVAAAVTPPGRAVVGSLRDAIGRETVVGVRRAEPAPVPLPPRGPPPVTQRG